MLTAAEQEARDRGWAVISETASPGLVERLIFEHLPGLLTRHDPNATRRRLTGLSFKVGVEWDTIDNHPVRAGLRNQLDDLSDILGGDGAGLLITVDEIHRQSVDELRQLTAVVQHAFREDREVAFAAAGLPSSVSDLLSGTILTFLRRADRHHLSAVDLSDVAEAIREPILSSARTISDEALDEAVRATDGYPFLIQLVGYHIWRRHPRETDVSLADVRAGIAAARRRMGSLVYEPSLADLSDVDRSFLLAMAVDSGPSRMADVAERLHVDKNYASQYRLRLLDSELIAPAGHGYVDFALPYLREYLQEHAASFLGLALPAAPNISDESQRAIGPATLPLPTPERRKGGPT
jgi:hypothetical protein